MGALTSQGCSLKVGDGATPTEAFTAIGEVTAINGLGSGSATEIDVTTLASLAKEFILGLKDEGSMTVSMNFDPANAQHDSLRADWDAGTLRNFELDLSDTPTTTISFSAYITTYPLTIAVDEKVGLELTLRISGAAVWSA